MLNKFSSEPLDSCAKSVVNTKGSQTMGNYLCDQVRRWLRKDEEFKANGKNDTKIIFQYSQCKKEWTPVTNDGDKFYAKEPLCCTNEGKFRRCDGTDFKKDDDCVKEEEEKED